MKALLLLLLALGPAHATFADEAGDAAAASPPGAPPDESAPGSFAAAATAAAPDPAFLNLPAYDVNPMESAQARVGDQLVLKVPGAGALPGAPGLHLALPKGTEPGTIMDQGLDVPALADSSDEGEGSPQPSPSASGTPAFEVAGADLKFTVIAAKPGQLAIPSLAIVDGTGKTLARTNPFTLQVASAIAPSDQKPKDPSPPRPPVMLSFPWIVIAGLVILALLAIAGIVYATVRWARRPKAKPAAPPAPPEKSEDEIALGALASLEREQLMRKGLYKKHYFQISEVLKAYLGARYRVDAVESTTREMLAMLEHATLPPESLRELEGMFTKLDFVKFTDHVPELPEGEDLLARARALVLKTRKPPVAQTPILAAAEEPVISGKGAPRAV